MSSLLALLAVAWLRSAGVAAQAVDYIVGPQDVLLITSYDETTLTGKFNVEADGTFTFPYVGRVTAGGLTLRQVEAGLKQKLVEAGIFKSPRITVAVEQYRSQKIDIVGEVRSPGSYPLSGDLSLVGALARAGSTLPTASGEVVIVRAGGDAGSKTSTDSDVVRINLRDLQNGQFSQNATLRDGDTVFVPRAESIYVFGQVRSPGAYALQDPTSTTVLQALSLAGGVSERGSTNGIRITRMVDGQKKELAVKLTDNVRPGDTVVVRERFF